MSAQPQPVVDLEQRRARRAAYQRWLEQVGVPLRFRELQLDRDLVPERVLRWADGFPEALRTDGGLILAGPPGTGKTTATIWVLRALYRTQRGIARPSALFARALAATDAFRGADGEQRALARRLAEVRLLILDDWRESTRDWLADRLDDLVDQRYGERRPTIVTTNLPAGADLGQHVTTFERRFPRTASRLLDSDGPGLVVVNREDLRRG